MVKYFLSCGMFAIMSITQYNAFVGGNYPTRWNNGSVLKTYILRNTAGSVVLQRNLDAEACGGYMACEQMRAVGVARECENFGKQCRGR